MHRRERQQRFLSQPGGQAVAKREQETEITSPGGTGLLRGGKNNYTSIRKMMFESSEKAALPNSTAEPPDTTSIAGEQVPKDLVTPRLCPPH